MYFCGVQAPQLSEGLHFVLTGSTAIALLSSTLRRAPNISDVCRRTCTVGEGHTRQRLGGSVAGCFWAHRIACGRKLIISYSYSTVIEHQVSFWGEPVEV